MGVYICKESTFRMIVSGLVQALSDGGKSAPWPPEILLPGWREASEDERAEIEQWLLQALFEMNVRAVEEAYGYADVKKAPKMKRVRVKPLNLLKALDCWLFQAYELLENHDNPILQALQQYADKLAHRLLMHTAAWQLARGWECEGF